MYISFIKAADQIKAAMAVEVHLTSGVAANMVAGEEPTAVLTVNGVTMVSCIDPNDPKGNILGGFNVPYIDRITGSGCTGATVSIFYKSIPLCSR